MGVNPRFEVLQVPEFEFTIDAFVSLDFQTSKGEFGVMIREYVLFNEGYILNVVYVQVMCVQQVRSELRKLFVVVFERIGACWA